MSWQEPLRGTRYQLLRTLKQQGDDSIVLARDTQTGEHVTIKLIRRGWSTERTPQVLREVLLQRHLSAAHHPHIVSWRGCLLTPTHLGLVMEAVDGEDLQVFLANTGGRVSEPLARFLFQQLVLALDFCAAKGLSTTPLRLSSTHLALTPGQLPLIKLAGLGWLADPFPRPNPFTTTTTNTGITITTPLISSNSNTSSNSSSWRGAPGISSALFAAPEALAQAASGSAAAPSAAGVVWSCGIVLFIMLFGRHPFLALQDTALPPQQQLEALVQRAAAGRLVLTAGEAAATSSACQQLLAAMLQPNPALRITLQAIQANPWFLSGLPEGAAIMNAVILAEEAALPPEPYAQSNAELEALVKAGQTIDQVFGHALPCNSGVSQQGPGTPTAGGASPAQPQQPGSARAEAAMAAAGPAAASSDSWQQQQQQQLLPVPDELVGLRQQYAAASEASGVSTPWGSLAGGGQAAAATSITTTTSSLQQQSALPHPPAAAAGCDGSVTGPCAMDVQRAQLLKQCPGVMAPAPTQPQQQQQQQVFQQQQKQQQAGGGLVPNRGYPGVPAGLHAESIGSNSAPAPPAPAFGWAPLSSPSITMTPAAATAAADGGSWTQTAPSPGPLTRTTAAAVAAAAVAAAAAVEGEQSQQQPVAAGSSETDRFHSLPVLPAGGGAAAMITTSIPTQQQQQQPATLTFNGSSNDSAYESMGADGGGGDAAGGAGGAGGPGGPTLLLAQQMAGLGLQQQQQQQQLPPAAAAQEGSVNPLLQDVWCHLLSPGCHPPAAGDPSPTQKPAQLWAAPAGAGAVSPCPSPVCHQASPAPLPAQLQLLQGITDITPFLVAPEEEALLGSLTSTSSMSLDLAQLSRLLDAGHPGELLRGSPWHQLCSSMSARNSNTTGGSAGVGQGPQ